MTDIQLLQQTLASRLPGLQSRLDSPEDPHGIWWLDLSLRGHSAVVEWRPDQGYGVSAPVAGGFGEGPDEVYPDMATTADRLLELLSNAKATQPPREMLLSKLRESRRLSQEELAQALNVRQSAISKLERRSDMYISTLRRVIAAMGGELEIRARFPEGMVRINQFEDLSA